MSHKIWRRVRNATLTVAVLIAMLASGCIPVAWVTPPLELEAAAGAMLREKRTQDGQEVSAAFPMSATFAPLQLFPSMDTRVVDLGIGYHLLPITSFRFNHGPHIDLAWLHSVNRPGFLGWAFSEEDRARVGLRLRGQVFFAREDAAVGRGAALQFSFEGFRFSNSDFGGCSLSSTKNRSGSTFGSGRDPDESAFCGSGYAWGESSVGVFAETSYARIDARDQWILSIGLKFRLPATFGAGFIAGNF